MAAVDLDGFGTALEKLLAELRTNLTGLHVQHLANRTAFQADWPGREEEEDVCAGTFGIESAAGKHSSPSSEFQDPRNEISGQTLEYGMVPTGATSRSHGSSDPVLEATLDVDADVDVDMGDSAENEEDNDFSYTSSSAVRHVGTNGKLKVFRLHVDWVSINEEEDDETGSSWFESRRVQKLISTKIEEARGEHSKRMIGRLFTEQYTSSMAAAWMSDDSRLLIHPRFIMKPHAPLRVWWDALACFMLAYDILMTPMQLVNMPEFFWVQVTAAVVMVYWTFDMVATFFVGYYKHDQDSELEMRPREIVLRYFQTWFVFDITLVTCDWMTTGVNLLGGSGSNTVNGVGIARIGKVARITRLVRLLRVAKAARVLSFLNWVQESLGFVYTSIVLSICKNMLLIVTVNHLFACIWFWLGNTQPGAPEGWVRHYGYGDTPWSDTYLISLRWSITQFTPGSSPIQPQLVLEQIFAICLLYFGLVVFSIFVSATTSQVNRLFSLKGIHRKKLFMLKSYLKQHRVPVELKERVVRYIEIATGASRDLTEDDVELLSVLSKPLREELQTHLRLRSLSVHPFFREMAFQAPSVSQGVCCQAISEIALSRADILFTAGQVAESMYFLMVGVLGYEPYKAEDRVNGSYLLIKSGQWCCEAVLWTKWLHRGTMRADVDSQILVIDAKQFREIVLKNHMERKFARRYGAAFCNVLNKSRLSATDLQSEVLLDRSVKHVLEQSHSMIFSASLQARRMMSKTTDLSGGTDELQEDVGSDGQASLHPGSEQTPAMSNTWSYPSSSQQMRNIDSSPQAPAGAGDMSHGAVDEIAVIQPELDTWQHTEV